MPTVDEALASVERLDNISFFKVGLQLFMTGGLPDLLHALRTKRVFVDLKLPGDISNTIAAVIDACVSMNVELLTLSESMPLPAIRGGARRARGTKQFAPEIPDGAGVVQSRRRRIASGAPGGENGVESGDRQAGAGRARRGVRRHHRVG